MIELLEDRLMVLPVEAEEKIGSIVLPDAAKEKSQRGVVVAVGPGKFYPELIAPHVHAGAKITHPYLGRKPLSADVGDTVAYGKHRGEAYKYDGKDHVILYEHDVIAVVERAS